MTNLRSVDKTHCLIDERNTFRGRYSAIIAIFLVRAACLTRITFQTQRQINQNAGRLS